MKELNEISTTLGQVPIEHLAVMAVLAGFALAGFAIHAVWSLARDKERR
ncbi:hypothetical protein [Methylobacterium isbiliense]|uniref:Uncharacterized protein n=1 Tax=Methylobacterium isbiliense TaxID=315478 RepID=A0ABQ4SJN3_9HYPH|nr:hypothetical protein [Methylobacterium isbiliense]MDN3627891.1 hypothetical protein [Methylobacterium isbiliense]GJE02710.1 hypothetical protein GMJLKIPL_4659 [Methylobacterium isbiliense]